MRYPMRPTPPSRETCMDRVVSSLVVEGRMPSCDRHCWLPVAIFPGEVVHQALLDGWEFCPVWAGDTIGAVILRRELSPQLSEDHS